MINLVQKERVIKIATGFVGHYYIDVMMAKSVLDRLAYTKKFNQKETATLTQMLDSPDLDNLELAMELIKTRLDGNSI